MTNLEIQDLINQTTNERQVEILIRLKELNKKAYLFMRQFRKTWKQKYHELWKQDFWKEAKKLLKEYFTIEGGGVLRCHECKKEIGKSFVLHHESEYYSSLNFFTPFVVNILCSNRCHSKKHTKVNI